MIEISHKHAQHLIREGIDRRLPDEQWAMLQAHLEGCPDCRAFSHRLTGSERRLNHTLRLRWGSARGPEKEIAHYLLARHARLVRFQAFLKKVAWVGLVLLALLGYWAYRRITAPERVVAPVVPTRMVAAGRQLTPTAEENFAFRGLLAYESTREGNADVFLLHASGGKLDVTNLTQHPSQDTAPTWSPDGEWIAFLSDRSGKNEVYVVTVAGTRLTQLTSDAGVSWQGPLDWSRDGSTIAVTGLRSGGGVSFLYLVGTDGSVPRSIAHTRGALPWARFSPSQSMLAYSTPPGSAVGLSLLNTVTGWSAWLTQEDNLAFQFAAVPGAFDWSLGGRSLVYAVDGPGTAANPEVQTGSLLRLSPEIGATGGGANFTGAGADTVDRLPTPGAFDAVSWVPSSLQIAALYDNGEDCRILRINHAYNRQVQPRDVDELCVLGGLERSSWTSDGNWLVLLAAERGADGAVPGLYALQPGAGDAAPVFERLGDAGEINAFAALRVRPTSRSLGLEPRRSQSLENPPEPLPALLPPAGGDDLPAWMFYTVRRGADDIILRARPDGSEAKELTPAGSRSGCPRIGPDGRVAFLSNMTESGELPSAGASREIFVIEPESGALARLTGGTLPESADAPDASVSHTYGCPSWSPDGSRLAAVLSIRGLSFLTVVRADRSAEPQFIPIDGAGLSGPVWLPPDENGKSSIMLVIPTGALPARLVEVDVDSDLPEDAREVSSTLLLGWDDAWGLSLSPDSSMLAALMVYYNNDSRFIGPTSAQMRIFDASTLEVLNAVAPVDFDPNAAGEGALAWAQDGSVRLARVTANIGSRKSVFERFFPREVAGENRLVETASFEDLVFHAVWGPGDWMIFAAESGLWAMSCPAEAEGRCAPAQISSEMVIDVEWK